VSAPHETSRSLTGLNGIRHGFFGRRGGVSTGDFAALNVSEASGDQPSLVAQNRALTAEAIGSPATSLATIRQTHSSIVHVITAPPIGERPEGDAMVTDVPGIVLGILTADCTPVLLADREAGVIGAFHAGWKGALDGIAQGTVVAMVALGADPARIVAAIGPTISQRNYEVGPDFARNVLARYPDAKSRFTTPAGGREHFDLPGFISDQLEGAGIGLVEDLDICTYAAPDAYFSHRYATHRGTTTGRQIALIGMA
jgi:YfiH family protein